MLISKISFNLTNKISCGLVFKVVCGNLGVVCGNSMDRDYRDNSFKN